MNTMSPLAVTDKMKTSQAGYLTLKTLAAYSSCSVRWLRDRLVARMHPLPHYRVEGKLLVKREEFDQWMTMHRTTQPAQNLAELVETVVSQIQKPRRIA